MLVGGGGGGVESSPSSMKSDGFFIERFSCGPVPGSGLCSGEARLEGILLDAKTLDLFHNFLFVNFPVKLTNFSTYCDKNSTKYL